VAVSTVFIDLSTLNEVLFPLLAATFPAALASILHFWCF
jgi:hypothetical protein